MHLAVVSRPKFICGMRAWINDGEASALTIGERVVFHFRAEKDCHLVLVQVDSHGVLTLLDPEFGSAGNRLVAGTTVSYPAPDAGFTLRAAPPLGPEVVFAIASKYALNLSAAELPEPGAAGKLLSLEDYPHIATELKRILT